MRNNRTIVLSATPEKISYSALVSAICEKINNSGELIDCENIGSIKAAIHNAEKGGAENGIK